MQTGAGLDLTREVPRESSRRESRAAPAAVLGNSLRAAGISRSRSFSSAAPENVGKDRPTSGRSPERRERHRDGDRDRDKGRDKDRDRDGGTGERQKTRAISSSRDPAHDLQNERASGSDRPKSARYSLRRTQSVKDVTGRPQTARESSFADTGREEGGGGRGGAYSYATDRESGSFVGTLLSDGGAPAAGAIERGRGNRNGGGSRQPSSEELLQRASERLVLQVSGTYGRVFGRGSLLCCSVASPGVSERLLC